MKLTLKKEHLIYVLLAVAVLVSVLPWLKQGIAVTDDFRHHVTKFWFLKYSFSHGGYSEWNPFLYSGTLLMHFYHPGSYFLSFPVILLFNPVTALKASIVLAYVVCGILTFIAANIFFKKKEIALIATTVYLFSNVRLVQANATGAVPRIWAMALAPAALLFLFNVIDKKDNKSIVLSALLIAICTITNVPTMYPVAIVGFIYYLFSLDIMNFSELKKSFIKNTKAVLLVLIISLMLVSFWFFPMMMEKKYGNIQEGSPTGTPTNPARLFVREFGKIRLSNGEVKDNYYLGYSIIVLSIIAIFLGWKDKRIRFLATSLAVVLFLDFFPRFLTPLPFASIGLQGTDVYFTLMITLLLGLLSGFATHGLYTSVKHKLNYLVYMAIFVIVVIDVAPAAYAFGYGWVKQPDWKFIETDASIDAWLKIKNVPGDFRVFSVVGLAPYMYHGKPELGYGWQGDPQAPPSEVFKINNEVYNDFIKNPADVKTNEVLGYLSVKFYVLPCIKDYEKFAPLFYSNNYVCIYQNPFYTALVISPENITIKESAELEDINPNSAIILEKCASDCFIKNENAEIKNVEWGLKKIGFDVSSIHKSYILVKSAYIEKHWSVYVNGKKVQARKAWPNYYLLEVPEGGSEIVLKYNSNKTHMIFDLVSLAGLAIVVFFTFRKTPKNEAKNEAKEAEN